MIILKVRQGLAGLVLAGCIIVPMTNAGAQFDASIPGFDASFPGIDGGLPGFDGGLPAFDGGLPGLDGGLPGLDGSLPGLDGGVVPLDGSTGTDASLGDAGTTTLPPTRSSSHGYCSVGASGSTAGSSATGWLASLGVLGLVLRRARRR